MTDAGNFEGAQHSQPAEDARAGGQDPGPRPEASCSENSPPREPSSSPSASSASIRQGRQGDRRLERPDDRRAGPRRGGAGRASLRRRRGEGRRLHPREAPTRPTAGCSTPGAHGQAKLDAYLDDYACLANGLISLYEATFDATRLEEAARLLDIVLTHFADPQAGGFFYTADDHEQLIARNKDVTDASVPSASGVTAYALVRLGKLTGDQKYIAAAEGTLDAAAGLMQQAPTAMGQMLLALDLQLGPTYELVLAGDPIRATVTKSLAEVRRQFLPNKVLAGADGKGDARILEPLLSGKPSAGDEPTLYLCEGFACQAPPRAPRPLRATSRPKRTLNRIRVARRRGGGHSSESSVFSSALIDFGGPTPTSL